MIRREHFTRSVIFYGLIASLALVSSAASNLRLPTKWAKDVSATNSHPDYPRPTMIRSNWLSLNGEWSVVIRTFQGPQIPLRQGKVLVPFPIESSLSGIQKNVGPNDQIEYQRNFVVPESWKGKRILLHFEAVDWEARVKLNDKELGIHRGGYDRFSFDVTEFLRDAPDQELEVFVRDPGDQGTQPRGKQSLNPKSIWYTGCSGIWQSVWLEPVSDVSVAGLRLTPDVEAGVLKIHFDYRGDTNGVEVELEASLTGKQVGLKRSAISSALVLPLSEKQLWSPEQPVLYDLKLRLLRAGREVDVVTSYFGMRSVSVKEDGNGRPRITLNGKPYFQLGPLDQGYWPDGIYTAPTDAALRSDIELLKQLGFNTSRKHVKIEPERWYYWCDKLGLLVWQDMPNGGPSPQGGQKEIKRTAESAQQFERELQHLIFGRYNHPSIVIWVPFNEGWGQYDTKRISDQVKEWDGSRLVICPSGWNDMEAGDVWSQHTYTRQMSFDFSSRRPIVCGEGAGFGMPVEGHVWNPSRVWSYSRYSKSEELNNIFVNWIKKYRQMESSGLSGAIFTQLTDVESEVNGLVTYDREVLKFNPKVLSEWSRDQLQSSSQ